MITPASPKPRFTRFFAGYCTRMLRKDFAHVRLLSRDGASGSALRALETHRGPAIAAINHASWWDPLIGLVLADAFAPTRVLASPIETAQLERFRFMRWIGLFGIEPDHPRALEAFVEHVDGLFRREPRTLLGLTPQGSFTDVRTPVRLRPGVGAVASRLDDPLVVCVSCEIVHWADKKPELLIGARVCARPDRPTTAGWTRAIGREMEAGRVELAEASIARDGSAFEELFSRGGSAVHPVYDLWLRLRGRRPEIDPARRGRGAGDGSPGGRTDEKNLSRGSVA